jgi:hypothetical protein
MEKRKSLLLKVALVVVLCSILTHWGDVKRRVKGLAQLIMKGLIRKRLLTFWV